ncbi:dCTP deaminase [Senegalia massiliensis]|uniref:dCTP deaminase n=1 Tax=Senegalia massiliensis TaxID=1720316 RepID=UPI001A931F16|nr:dCTP deaminase [Senegalia massiliensis]
MKGEYDFCFCIDHTINIMILTRNKIYEEYLNKKIDINPFNKKNLSTNSYDLSLFPELIFYTQDVLDPKLDNPYKKIKIPPEGLKLNKGEFCLGASMEVIGSDFYVPIIHGKSGIARLGLFVHVTADLIDIGYKGRITFQFMPTEDVVVYPNMSIGQMTFWQPLGEITLYDGKYQNGKGPATSKTYLDYEND